jgi:hypothetical protein
MPAYLFEEKEQPSTQLGAVWILDENVLGNPVLTVFATRGGAVEWKRARERELLQWCVQAKCVWRVSLSIVHHSGGYRGQCILQFSDEGPPPPRRAVRLHNQRNQRRLFAEGELVQRLERWWNGLRPDTVWDEAFSCLCMDAEMFVRESAIEEHTVLL